MELAVLSLKVAEEKEDILSTLKVNVLWNVMLLMQKIWLLEMLFPEPWPLKSERAGQLDEIFEMVLI